MSNAPENLDVIDELPQADVAPPPETVEERAAREAAELAEIERLERKAFEARVANTVYDPETLIRQPNGAIECVITDPATGKTRPTGLTATAKSEYNRALFARIEAEMGDAIPTPPPPTLDVVKAQALLGVDVAHAEQLRHLTGDATPEERDTWAAKADAATAYLASDANEAQIAMLEAEASGAGVETPALAAVIVGKASAYLRLVGFAAGLRAKARTAIAACETPEALLSITATLTTEMTAAVAALAAAANNGEE